MYTSRWFKRSLTVTVAISLVGLMACGGSESIHTGSDTPPVAQQPETGVAGDGRLDLIVDFIRQDNGLPAIAAIMLHNDEIIEKTAVGFRSADASIQVSENDKWHIGSVTKSMTSTLAARLVQNGVVNWDTTIAEVYPELVGVMLPEYEAVRLDELLSHLSGLPFEESQIPGVESYFTDDREITIQRQEIVEKALVISSTVPRGQYIYSNIGYIVAGAMLERLTGSSWELLMKSQLFDPLGMANAGFGAPDTQANLMQPVGHILIGDDWQPVDPQLEDYADNPPVVGPAGTVHASLLDMASYMKVHLNGFQGESIDGFLDPAQFVKLHSSASNANYALGWIVINSDRISHDGSNDMWTAMLVLDRQKNIALFSVTNAADGHLGDNSTAYAALFSVLDELIARADAAF